MLLPIKVVLIISGHPVLRIQIGWQQNCQRRTYNPTYKLSPLINSSYRLPSPNLWNLYFFIGRELFSGCKPYKTKLFYIFLILNKVFLSGISSFSCHQKDKYTSVYILSHCFQTKHLNRGQHKWNTTYYRLGSWNVGLQQFVAKNWIFKSTPVCWFRLIQSSEIELCLNLPPKFIRKHLFRLRKLRCLVMNNS